MTLLRSGVSRDPFARARGRQTAPISGKTFVRSDPFRRSGCHRFAHRFLFEIGKTGNAFPFDERSILMHHLAEHARRMTDGCHRFSGVIEVLDQFDEIRIVGEIPQRPMPTDIEDGVEIRR